MLSYWSAEQAVNVLQTRSEVSEPAELSYSSAEHVFQATQAAAPAPEKKPFSHGAQLWSCAPEYAPAEQALHVPCALAVAAVSSWPSPHHGCWSHSLWREEGDCEQGSVPMTSRFLIAVAAEHIVLGLVFLIDQGVPNMQVTGRHRYHHLLLLL